jgi:two-component system phosphate regulon sensor histidine kinase PhoR
MTGGALAAAILLALALSLILSKITSEPLREMAAAAARIGKRDGYSPIPVTSRDEIGALATVLNEMARRIDHQMHSLAAEKLRLDTILRGMGEGVMVATADGKITLVNPAFRQMFAISGEVEGKRLIEISRNPDLQSAFHDLSVSGRDLTREIHIPPGNITLLTHWVPLTVDGSGDGVVAVFHDITDMKYVEEMRRDFVANVSHELRTPVSVIKGYAETLLLDGVLTSEPEQVARFVGIIHNHAERLTTLINDILTLSRLESKTAALDLNDLDIASTATRSCILLSDQAAQKNIRLLNEVGPGLPRVMADQGRMEQVLVNLIDNAVKYTPEGGSVRLFAEQGETFVRISVEDSGIGIPAKDLPRIFERFYRVDEGRSRDKGGTGLGLAITKHIIQLHGGEITVSSVSGKGSAFSFTLQIAKTVAAKV